MKVRVTDIHNQDHDFEAEKLELRTEGVNTKVVQVDGPSFKVLGVFANVASAVVEA